MAIYHCSIQVISRGAGRSAVAAAAYRSGSNLENEWSGLPANYENKKGVAYSEIMLPTNAPPEFSDRQTLWNSVEMNEKRKDGQLAREIEVSLPKELDLEEHRKIIKDYCQQFVDAGMCVDFSIHDKHDGNPHCHIMLTMRALDENGKWLPKSHQEFDLDENGERIRLPNGRWKSHKVFTTDWDDHGKADQWRASWAETVNRYLEANKIPERIDHRSNAERGMAEIPTIHEGPVSRAMEKKGIVTERGEINRQIKAVNRIIRQIRDGIKEFTGWISDVKDTMKELMEQDNSPSLNDLMLKYLDKQNASFMKYSATFRLKKYAEGYAEFEPVLDKLRAEGIYTLNDLETALASMRKETAAVQRTVKDKGDRRKELKEMIRQGNLFLKNNPIHKEAQSIKWKRSREKFEDQHSTELALWNAADKYLHEEKKVTGSIAEHLKEWRSELAELNENYDVEYKGLQDMRSKLKDITDLRDKMRKGLEPEQDRQKQKNKKRNIEI